MNKANMIDQPDDQIGSQHEETDSEEGVRDDIHGGDGKRSYVWPCP
jgi:hypothetical protein